jgi:hypothetical protein
LHAPSELEIPLLTLFLPFLEREVNKALLAPGKISPAIGKEVPILQNTTTAYW